MSQATLYLWMRQALIDAGRPRNSRAPGDEALSEQLCSWPILQSVVGKRSFGT